MFAKNSHFIEQQKEKQEEKCKIARQPAHLIRKIQHAEQRRRRTVYNKKKKGKQFCQDFVKIIEKNHLTLNLRWKLL